MFDVPTVVSTGTMGYLLCAVNRRRLLGTDRTDSPATERRRGQEEDGGEGDGCRADQEGEIC